VEDLEEASCLAVLLFPEGASYLEVLSSGAFQAFQGEAYLGVLEVLSLEAFQVAFLEEACLGVAFQVAFLFQAFQEAS